MSRTLVLLLYFGDGDVWLGTVILLAHYYAENTWHVALSATRGPAQPVTRPLRSSRTSEVQSVEHQLPVS